RQPELESRALEIEGVAGFADDGLVTVDLHGGDYAELIGLANMDEAVEQARRQLAHGAEEAVVLGARRQPAEIILDVFGVARLDEAHRDGLAALRAQHIRVLAEIIKAQGGHETLPRLRRKPAPLYGGGAGFIGGPSGPPERFVDLI